MPYKILYIFPFSGSHVQEPGDTTQSGTEQPQHTESSESGLGVESDGYYGTEGDDVARWQKIFHVYMSIFGL